MVEWLVARHRPSTRADKGSGPVPGPLLRVPPCYRVPLGAPQTSRCHAPASRAAAGTNRCIDILAGVPFYVESMVFARFAKLDWTIN
jgi:hypothetical protein